MPGRRPWQGPMTAPGTWCSSPRRAIAVRPTVSRLRYPAEGSPRRAVARSPGASAGTVWWQSASRSVHHTPAAADGWSEIRARVAGAESLPATGAAVAGRRHEIDFSDAVRKRPARSSDGPHSNSRTKLRTQRSPLGSARRQDHHDLTSLEARILLDLGELGDIGLDLVEQLGADFLVGHFAAPVAQGDLDLVAFLEEALHCPHLHVIVVIVDHRPQLDLLDLDDLLFLAGLRGLLLRGIFELPVVHNLANGRTGVRRNLDEIHAGFERHLDGDHGLDR